METIFDELKQFIVRKIVCSDGIDFGKKYLLCLCLRDKEKISHLIMINGTDTFMINGTDTFTNFCTNILSKNHKYMLYEFEHIFDSNKFIEIFIRIIANNDCNDLEIDDRKIVLGNDKYLFYGRYNASDENYYNNENKSIFYKQAKLNGIDYFNDKYRIYFYV